MRQAITQEQSGRWTNRHQAVSLEVERLIDVWNPQPPSGLTVLQDIRATADAIRELIAECEGAGKELRAVGGTWSLSGAATSPHVMLNTKPLNLRFPIAAGSVEAGSPFTADSLFYFQCGNSVGEVYQYLEARGRTLHTSGASNGQTIVGAISTGTHGAAFQYGSMPEMVAAIHLICGPNPEDVIWLERPSAPALSNTFATRIGARLVRTAASEDLFKAALVSFGSMGVVMGVLLHTAPLYKMRALRRTVPINANVQQLMRSMDIGLLPGIVPEVLAPGNVRHVEVVVNPHNANAQVHLTIMERVPTDTPSSAPFQADHVGPGDDVLELVGGLADVAPGLVPDAARALLSAAYGDLGPMVGTPFEIFHTTTTHGKATSVEIGVPMERSPEALQMVLTLTPEIDAYAGVVAVRYVKQTRSLLGFAQWPITATFEFPGAYGHSTLAFYDALFAAFAASDIPYAIHWGQVAPARPETLTHIAANVVRWKAAREALLRPEIRPVFSNEMTRGFGLT